MEKSNRGFTLVELMVVSGILLVSIGFGSAQYNTYTQQRRLREEVKKMITIMTLAGKRAVSGDSGTGCTDFQGFQIAVTPGGTYTSRRCCESACNSAQSAIASSESLPLGLTFTAPAVNTTYLFNKLNQAVTINPPVNQTITIRNTVLSRCISLTIAPSGLITQTPEVAC
jgi:prepilin-type N-terminal cleavage/methylation domain-containing protein